MSLESGNFSNNEEAEIIEAETKNIKNEIETSEQFGVMEGEDSFKKAISSIIDDLGASSFIELPDVLQLWNLSDDEKKLLICGSDPGEFLSMTDEERTGLTKIQEEGRALIRSMMDSPIDETL